MPYHIKSKLPQGRFRCGAYHSHTGSIWTDKAFAKHQLAAIKADPMLTVCKLSDGEAQELRASGVAVFTEVVMFPVPPASETAQDSGTGAVQ